MNKLLGIILIVLGLAIAIVPGFTDCAAHGKYMTVMGAQLPMVCHWSARAEIATGVPMLGIGTIMVFTSRKGGLMSLSALGVIIGGLTIALPQTIIGTCPGPTMFCNTVMKPAVTVLGTLAVVSSLGGLVLARRADS